MGCLMLSGRRHRWRERHLRVGGQQTSGAEHDIVAAGQQGSDRQPAAPVSEERDAAGRAAAGGVAVILCQVRKNKPRGAEVQKSFCPNFMFFVNRIKELEKRKSNIDALTQTIETKEADAKEELGKEVKIVTQNCEICLCL